MFNVNQTAIESDYRFDYSNIKRC